MENPPQLAGEEIWPGIGGHGPEDVKKAFDGSVRELEQRAAEAEREAKPCRSAAAVQRAPQCP